MFNLNCATFSPFAVMGGFLSILHLSVFRTEATSSSVSRDRGHSGLLLGSISESNFQNGGLNERAKVCGVGRLLAAA